LTATVHRRLILERASSDAAVGLGLLADVDHLLDLRTVLADLLLDHVAQRGVGRGATRAGALEAHARGRPVHGHELEIPAVGLQDRPDLVERLAHPLFDGHRRSPRSAERGECGGARRCCQPARAASRRLKSPVRES
jgi:hypothetical protein